MKNALWYVTAMAALVFAAGLLAPAAEGTEPIPTALAWGDGDNHGIFHHERLGTVSLELVELNGAPPVIDDDGYSKLWWIVFHAKTDEGLDVIGMRIRKVEPSGLGSVIQSCRLDQQGSLQEVAPGSARYTLGPIWASLVINMHPECYDQTPPALERLFEGEFSLEIKNGGLELTSSEGEVARFVERDMTLTNAHAVARRAEE